ncbi:uncharacterized protein LOC119728741 isoform X1 [Patiria miniata]|uniref:Uncharacterized protein n=1 Tax=Patiria miniata TaxID=46514 RepID=A0A913ZZG6_PATMI|nr:uncharacterized protein LOC119728741 isoform X1 [Patiria miniata]
MFHPSNSSATLRQSKPMPKWLWLCISKSLGIKTHPQDKPILATALYIFTLACTMTYFVTCTWYVVYDIEATTTKYDVLNGSVTVIMAAGFCCVTVYANLLAFKLFTNSVFRQSLRLHSKTILKVNASLLLVVLSLLFIGIYAYISYCSESGAEPCESVNLSPIICYIRFPSQTVLSVISFIWNLMVAVVCMSVCRTHTISIRHFLLELDDDAMIYEMQNRHSAIPITMSDGASVQERQLEESVGGDDTRLDIKEDLDVRRIEAAWDRSEFERRQHRVSSCLTEGHAALADGDGLEQELPDTAADHADRGPGTTRGVVPRQRESVTSAFVHTGAVKLLTKAEILDRYWRLQCRLNTTSAILQRWITCWIILILLWSLYYLMYWIDHDASILDMIIFFIPLFLLPLLCSGPIEVNGEGERVAKMICPTHERMEVIMFIRQAPLSFTIYGFVLNYSTIVTAILAIAVAFGTKIIVGNLSGEGLPIISTVAPHQVV